jgi:DNA modification methylase
LQLDVIDRIVYLYTNPGETVLTPFMGVGSEVYSPVSMGRKAIGIELKESYFKQATLNLKEAALRFKKIDQQSLF